jgi:hypothetical protein
LDYRIICTNQEPVYLPNSHAHIVAVGTGTDPAHYDRKWTLVEVLAAMAFNRFYTVSPSTGAVALVRRADCVCGRPIIKSAPDAVKDNNLDSLPRCA